MALILGLLLLKLLLQMCLLLLQHRYRGQQLVLIVSHDIYIGQQRFHSYGKDILRRSFRFYTIRLSSIHFDHNLQCLRLFQHPIHVTLFHLILTCLVRGSRGT
jgi:hypothetical protein